MPHVRAFFGGVANEKKRMISETRNEAGDTASGMKRCLDWNCEDKYTKKETHPCFSFCPQQRRSEEMMWYAWT